MSESIFPILYRLLIETYLVYNCRFEIHYKKMVSTTNHVAFKKKIVRDAWGRRKAIVPPIL